MRFLITLLMFTFAATPAFAKSKANHAQHAKAEAKAPSKFTGQLLTYDQLMGLSKAKRKKYLKDVVELVATMESFNNRYTVAEREALQEFREQIAQLMQMVSIMPEAQAADAPDEYADTTPEVDVSKIVPVHNGVEWTCGRGAKFDYVIRTCTALNGTDLNAFSPSDGDAAGNVCPSGTKQVPHYRPPAFACIPNASYALIPEARRSGIAKGGYLSPKYLRDLPIEQQRAAVLGGAPDSDMPSAPPPSTPPGAGTVGDSAPPAAPASGSGLPGVPLPDAPGDIGGGTTNPGHVGGGQTNPGHVGVGQSAPPAARNSCEPASQSCKKLSAADRETAITRFRSTADYQGVNANVCIAGGFASKYTTTKKTPGSCKPILSLDLGNGKKTKPCEAGEILCNPVLFCVGGRDPKGNFAPVTFCVKKKGEGATDNKNLPFTDSCAAKHGQMVANKIPLIECGGVDPKWPESRKKLVKAECEKLKKIKGESCDPKYLPASADGQRVWKELTAATAQLRDVWCGKEDFAALFCRECEIISDKIYAMNKEATGTGCPEVRGPATGAPANPAAEPAAPASTPGAGAVREGQPNYGTRPDGH